MPSIEIDESGQYCISTGDDDDPFDAWCLTHASLEEQVEARVASLSAESRSEYRRRLLSYGRLHDSIQLLRGAFLEREALATLREGAALRGWSVWFACGIALATALSLPAGGWLALGTGVVPGMLLAVSLRRRRRTHALAKVSRDAEAVQYMEQIEQRMRLLGIRESVVQLLSRRDPESVRDTLVRQLSARQQLLDALAGPATGIYQQASLPGFQ